MFDNLDVRLTQKIKQIQVAAEPNAAQPQSSPVRPTTPGGIDLNPRRMTTEHRGPGLRLTLPADIRLVPDGPITGLTPVIIRVTPVGDLPAFLRIQ